MVFLLAFGCGYYLGSRPPEVSTDLKASDWKHYRTIDSLKTALRKSKLRDETLSRELEVSRENGARLLRESKTFQVRYERLLKGPLQRFKDSQIDSILKKLYP